MCGAEEKLNLEKMSLFQLSVRENLLKVKPSSRGPSGLPSWWISVLRSVHAQAGCLSVRGVVGDSCSGNLDSITSFRGPITISCTMYVPATSYHPWTVFSWNRRETGFLNSSSFALVLSRPWILRTGSSEKPRVSVPRQPMRSPLLSLVSAFRLLKL